MSKSLLNETTACTSCPEGTLLVNLGGACNLGRKLLLADSDVFDRMDKGLRIGAERFSMLIRAGLESPIVEVINNKPLALALLSSSRREFSRELRPSTT